MTGAIVDRIQNMLDEPDVRDEPVMLGTINDFRADVAHTLVTLEYLKDLGGMLHDEGISSATDINDLLAAKLNPIVEELAAAVTRIRGVEQ